MSRTSVTVRRADIADAPALREVWADVLRSGSPAEQCADVEAVIASCEGADDKMIAIAECEGEVAGAVFLQATTLTPLNLEPSVLTVSPHVLPQYRRRGVGTALIETATRFAERREIATIFTAANANHRDANRFMARLSFAPHATLRAAATVAVRAKLSTRRTTPTPLRARHVDRVLAARRRREHATG